MLKKFTFKRVAITSLLLLLALILYNYPEEINVVQSNPKQEVMDIYLLDENKYVAMTKKEKTSTNLYDTITEILNALIIGNDDKSLPEGFSPIIPEGTTVLDFELKDGLLKVNFSKEFLNVSLEDESKMIEAIVYSLTTLREVKKVMIFVENENLTALPNSKKNIDLVLDRHFGINKVVNIDDIHGTQMVTVYYLGKNEDYYYIPVSIVSNGNTNADKVEIIINNLKSNRLNNSDLLSHLDYQVELMDYIETEQEIQINFNQVLLDSVYDGKLKEEVKYAVFYSIYDTLGIENVVFMVNSNKIDEFRLEN